MNVHFLIPGNIDNLTGGNIYNRQMIKGLMEKGHHVKIHQLEESFPFPDESALSAAKKIIEQIPSGDPIIIDSLALGPLLSVLTLFYGKNPLIALMHLPLSFNSQFSLSQREILAQKEKSVLSMTSGIVVTSEYTGRLIAEWGIDPTAIHTILPGAEAIKRKTFYPILPRRILCIANYTENKGHLLLVKSLSLIKNYDWILDCYGHKDFDKEFVEELVSVIQQNSLENRILLHGPVSGSALTAAYLNADLYVLPSYFETYGMTISEALAHGIPVIASTGGGLPDTVPPTMGLLFRPGDGHELQLIIKAILENPWLYKKLWNEAAKYYKQANSWAQSIERFEQLLLSLFYPEHQNTKEKSNE